MSHYPTTDLNRVRRVPDRGHYDRETVHSILDASVYCHVGLLEEDQPVIIPTIHVRVEDTIYLHGATTSRLLRYVGSGRPTCISVTLLDGLVLARSVFHHSMNYRAVVAFGRGRLIEGDDRKMAALERFTERIVPGRWSEARQPNAQELRATAVAAIPIDMATAKIRTGPPKDDAEDYALPIWAGVLPLRQEVLDPIEDLPAGHPLPYPPSVVEYLEAKRR
jgi:nitroimidazol reductase NimA-like FMN-containing flavoprotein (pyridoxamine 5'-phosphate oxidase superfamily)